MDHRKPPPEKVEVKAEVKAKVVPAQKVAKQPSVAP
jgi:hypothetical protein